MVAGGLENMCRAMREQDKAEELTQELMRVLVGATWRESVWENGLLLSRPRC